MKQEPTKEELKEMMQFQVLSVEDLSEARRKETFFRYWQRTKQPPYELETKLNYLIYKHELEL